MTIAERNRRIAIALGWTCYKSRDGRFDEWVAPEQLHYVVEAGKTHSAVAACSSSLPDFYRDEAASAMLLEAMPEPDLYVESSKGEPKLWACNPDIMQEDPDRNPHYSFKMHADRKTCIADAFVALLESGWRVK